MLEVQILPKVSLSFHFQLFILQRIVRHSSHDFYQNDRQLFHTSRKDDRWGLQLTENESLRRTTLSLVLRTKRRQCRRRGRRKPSVELSSPVLVLARGKLHRGHLCPLRRKRASLLRTSLSRIDSGDQVECGFDRSVNFDEAVGIYLYHNTLMHQVL